MILVQWMRVFSTAILRWALRSISSWHLQSFLDARPEQIQEVVQTNLVGCLLCTRAAIRIMAAQPRGGHIFNMDGAGADGLPSPQYAAYGATKAGGMSSSSRRARCAMRCHNN